MRLLFLLLLMPGLLAAQDVNWNEIETELEMRDRRIKQLEERVNHLWDDVHDKLDPHGEKDAHDHDGEVRFRLIDLSLNIMTVFGTSTSTNEELEGLQLGNHDPRRRGFTLQQAELAFAGALEPYFAGEAYLVATEQTVELEEAFLRSLFLPWLELKGGYFFTEFGRINKLHPHEWRFTDQAVAVGRMLGAEGMRGLGARVAFELDAPWHTKWLLAAQNADDASMTSFLGEGHSHGHEEEEHGEETIGGYPRVERRVRNIGDLLYSFRWENAFDLGEHFRIEPGVSFATGPNATGETGRTWLVGGDLMFEWRNNGAFARVEGEFIYRYFQANRGEHEGEVLEPTVLGDWGWYVEITGSPISQFYMGVRVEHASGFRSGEELREEDPRRDDRWRISPIAAYQPIDEFAVTLQYNFDHTEHLGGETSHSVWLGLRVLFGVHKHIH